MARIDFRTEMLTWTGVGNVGFRLPKIPVPEAVRMRPGHLLVMASDGIAEDHLDGLEFAASSEAIANRILGEHTRVTDDALVLVARHRGGI